MPEELKEIIDFTLLFNRYKNKVFSFVLKMIEDRMTAEDIVQDVFVKLYQNMDNIRQKESIKFWIYTTARNEVYTYLRRKKIRKDQYNTEDTDELEKQDENDLQDVFDQKEFRELLNRELEGMDHELKEIFVLREYSALSYSEIAGLLSIEEKLVKSRLFSVRQKLIKKLSHQLK